MAVRVLDSFALLAYFRGEPTAEVVRDLLVKAARDDKAMHMSEVNYAEVKYILLRKNGEDGWGEAAAVLQTLPIEFHAATRALSDLAADFKAKHALSLADAFAAALAKEKKAELVTGDPEFEQLEDEVKIMWIKSGKTRA